MKVTLTKSELLPILTKHFGMSVTDVELEISMGPTAAELINRAISGLRYISDQKIEAIKALRQVTADNPSTFDRTLSLADAKWAIEHFNVFQTFVTETNRLPHAAFCDGVLR